jgi:hypothetical protein
MGLLSSRWAAVLLAAAIAIPAAVWAQEEPEPYKPIQQVQCWSCHSTTAYKDYPPLKNFFTILPPASASGIPGEPFTYVIQVQNAWGADLRFVRPTLDLTEAPAIAFVSDVPPVSEQLLGVIPVNPQALQSPQRDTKAYEMPVGLTRLKVTLTPEDQGATGPDLKLRITGPSGMTREVNQGQRASPPQTGAGVPETFILDTREQFAAFGYGNWTFVAETQVVPSDPAQLPGGSVPAQQYRYTLKIEASADAIEDRMLAIPIGGDPVKPGGSRAFTYNLVALQEPEAEQTIRLWVDSWVHYSHDESPPNPNDENVTREFSPPIKVEQGVTLTADTTTAVVIPGVQNGATMATVSEAIGYAATFLLISSVWTGGMFGKASRRQLNTVFGSAKRRVAFHNFLSYGIILAAVVHTVLFIIETAYYWTVGVIWGGAAILAMLGLGLTGAFQVQMIRKWSYGFWRWSHYGLAIAAIVFTLLHFLFDGVHFADLREPFGWKDPLDPRDVTV